MSTQSALLRRFTDLADRCSDLGHAFILGKFRPCLVSLPDAAVQVLVECRCIESAKQVLGWDSVTPGGIQALSVYFCRESGDARQTSENALRYFKELTSQARALPLVPFRNQFRGRVEAFGVLDDKKATIAWNEGPFLHDYELGFLEHLYQTGGPRTYVRACDGEKSLEVLSLPCNLLLASQFAVEAIVGDSSPIMASATDSQLALVAPAFTSTHPSLQDETPKVSKWGRPVLMALAKRFPGVMSCEALLMRDGTPDSPMPSKNLIPKVLQELIAARYVVQPFGEKGGYAATDLGKKAAEQLAGDSG